MFVADQRRSSSTTSKVGIMFHLSVDLSSGKQRIGSIGVEERSQFRIPTHDFRQVECANPHVLKETNDLFLSFRNPRLDEWQAPLAIDRVERLKYQSVALLAARTWNHRDEHIVVPGLTGHSPQEGQTKEWHVTRDNQAMLVRGRCDRCVDSAESPDLRTQVRNDSRSERRIPFL